MKSNTSSLDRAVRVIAAILIAALYYLQVISGITAIVLLGLAAVFLITASINFCPLYSIFGISTRKKEK